jgi:hypothetical protein
VRYSKVFGAAVFGALATMAFLGASIAAAETTALCKKHENPCAAANIYVGHFDAVAENPKLLTNITTIECQKAHLLGYALGLANPLTIHLEDFSFFEDCLTATGHVCTFEDVELGLALLLRTGSNLGSLQLHNTKVLVSCPEAFIHCVYGGLPVFHAIGSPNKEALATLHANEATLENGEGLFCPEEAKLDALYKVVLPDPIVISS